MKAKNSILAIFIVSLFAVLVLATPTTLNEKNLCKLKNMYSTSAPSGKDNTLKPIVQEFQQKYSTCSEMEGLVDLYSNDTLPHYEMATEGSLNADSSITYDVLKEYSPQELDAKYEKFLNKFVGKYGSKISEVKDILKKKGGGMGVKMLPCTCPITISGSHMQIFNFCCLEKRVVCPVTVSGTNNQIFNFCLLDKSLVFPVTLSGSNNKMFNFSFLKKNVDELIANSSAT